MVEDAVSIFGIPDVKSPGLTLSSGIDCYVPILHSEYNEIVEEARTNLAQWGGKVAVCRYGTVVKLTSYTT